MTDLPTAAGEETFNNPQGLFVTGNNHIYIADTENGRIVELDDKGILVRIIGAPESEILPEDFVYKPLKIAVDKAKRIYAVGSGVYDGLIEFDSDGGFIGFIGANRVAASLVDYFWKLIFNKRTEGIHEIIYSNSIQQPGYR